MFDRFWGYVIPARAALGQRYTKLLESWSAPIRRLSHLLPPKITRLPRRQQWSPLPDTVTWNARFYLYFFRRWKSPHLGRTQQRWTQPKSSNTCVRRKHKNEVRNKYESYAACRNIKFVAWRKADLHSPEIYILAGCDKLRSSCYTPTYLEARVDCSCFLYTLHSPFLSHTRQREAYFGL